MRLFKKTVAATLGLVAGGLTTLMVVNAASEGKRGTDVFSGHDNHNFYALDVVNAALCAGIGYALASYCERYETIRINFDGFRRLSEPKRFPDAQEPFQTIIVPSAPSK